MCVFVCVCAITVLSITLCFSYFSDITLYSLKLHYISRYMLYSCFIYIYIYILYIYIYIYIYIYNIYI